MRVEIQSNGIYVTRTRWFINSETGISVKYFWRATSASVIVDTTCLEEGCESEWTEFLGPCHEKSDNPDEVELQVDYPAPWFFKDPETALTWNIPAPFDIKDRNFRLILSCSHVFEKATELAARGARNQWSTLDADFVWKTPNIKAAAKQKVDEFSNLAKLFNSSAWSSDEGLDQFMNDKFSMEIEDDAFTFYNPTMKPIEMIG